jgi:hypothetical protein
MIAQILIPARSIIYPSNVLWSGEGHRFSWRMKMLNRKAKGYFIVIDKDTGKKWRISGREFLTYRQMRKMLTRPDMIHQFAHYLRRRWSQIGYGKVAVHAVIAKSLNGRRFQQYVDPSVDLASLPLDPFKPIGWLVALKTPLKGERNDSYAGVRTRY